MDSTKLLLISLFLVLFLIWDAWKQDYGVPHPPSPESAKLATPTTPVQDVPATPISGEAPVAAVPKEPALLQEQSKRLQVKTDVFDIELNTIGGVIEKLKLLDYPVSRTTPNDPMVLLNNSPGLVHIAQGGLLSSTGDAPDHNAEYTVAQNDYELAEGQDSLDVTLTWGSENALEVSKIYTFHRGSYLIGLRYEIRNHRSEAWVGWPYAQLQRGYTEVKRGFTQVYTYTGTAISSPEKRYEKISFDAMRQQALDRDITDGWAAVIQHYFLAAMIPDTGTAYHYYSKVLEGNRFLIGVRGPELRVPPGGTAVTTIKLYIGPKVQQVLADVAPGLELTADYGVLWFIAKPLFWILAKLHALTGNWGWAIILVTVLLKLAFYQLSAKSYQSMAKMRRLQPRLVAIRERYQEDKARLNQAMMDLYKEEKINPLGGCLPIVVQIPVFISLYWVLLETVELRQASFMFWINDLSAPDPYFVLPLLMGVSMYLQQKLSPAAMDPLQQKIFQAMPWMFTVFFAFFASGLVLYWLVNNVLSITQQWVITKRFGGVAKPAKTGP